LSLIGEPFFNLPRGAETTLSYLFVGVSLIGVLVRTLPGTACIGMVPIVL
jgi:hypothetical protein